MEKEQKKQLLQGVISEGGHGMQARLARHMKVTPKTVYLWQWGKEWMKESEEEKLWAFFGYKLDENGAVVKIEFSPPATPAPFADWTLELQKARDILPSLFTTKERETLHMLLSRLAAAFQPENHSEEK